MTVAQENEDEGRPVIVVVGASSKLGNIPKEEEATQDDGSSSSSRSTRWGLGGALALPFAKLGFDIVLMGRRRCVLDDVKKLIEEGVQRNNDEPHDERVILCVECDVTDDASVKNAFDCAHQDISSFGGFIDLVMFNAAAPYPPKFKFAKWGDVLLPHQIDIANLDHQYDTQINGLIRCSKHVVPGMIERKRGCILVSGSSICNLHGRYEFGSVAPPRAALRSLAQCMFQAYGPMGIHVCTINIGGLIDTPKTRTWNSVGDPLVDPHAVAEQYLNAYRQHPTVWSYEIQLTPSFAARKIDMRM